MAELSIEVKQIGGGIAEIKAVGYLDAASYEKMEKTIATLFARGCYKLICNLEGVEYISSAGAGVFLGSVDTAQEHHGNIVLLRPSKEVQEIFSILGLVEIFPYAQTVEEARKILGK
jgi:anti-sigma B factor antagonist